MTDLVIPQGQLLQSRVVPDIRTVLTEALDRSLTGYAILEPQNASRFNSNEKGILTFEVGIPVLAYHTGTDTGGTNALSEFVTGGSFRFDLYGLSSDQLETIHDTPELRVPPEMPANHLAGDPVLAARTRRVAAQPKQRSSRSEGLNAVEEFLEDAERIEAIREQARTEAKRHAHDWGLNDQLE